MVDGRAARPGYDDRVPGLWRPGTAPAWPAGPCCRKGERAMESILFNRAALAVLGLVGVAMCANGIGRVAAAGRWLDPLSFAAYAFGAAALVVVAAGLFGWKLPLISSVRDAEVALLAVIVLKIALTALHHVA